MRFPRQNVEFSVAILDDESCTSSTQKWQKNSWTVRKVGHEYGLDPKPIREVTKSDDASFLHANK